jgi:NADH-quinone oxidoreductase subunit A
MSANYFSLLAVFIIALGLCGVFLFLSTFFGPKKSNPVKANPFECGLDQLNPPRVKFSIHFYVIAMLFIIFDVEVAFIYPWAVLFKSLGIPGFIEMSIFILVLLVGLLYAWLRGALEWD